MRRPTDRHLSLAIPGLFGPLLDASAPAESLRAFSSSLSLESLETLLGRADAYRSAESDATLEACLCTAFGVPASERAGWPVAALTRVLDGGDTEAACQLRADPVHIRTGFNEATLLTPADGDLRVAEVEAGRFCAILNEAFAEEGMRIEALAPTRWYLQLPVLPEVRFSSLYEFAGGSVRDRLPAGADGARWRRLMTLSQTALFDCEPNVERERAGQLPVNSLWFFGAGALPPAPTSTPFAQVWADHELAQALALHAGVPCCPAPADAHEWLRLATTPGRHLLLLEQGHRAGRSADVAGWCWWIENLQTTWMQPLAVALRDGRLASLSLLAGGGLAYRCTRWTGWRLWRRRSRLEQLARVRR